MNEKLDLRVQKTYNALFEAFINLLEEKSFEEITINELCEKAMTRRATFYKHFSDKYDFCAFMIRYLRLQFIKDAEKNIDPHNPLDYYRTLLKIGMDFIDKNEHLIQSAMKHHSSILLTMLDTTHDLSEELQKHIEEDTKNGVQFIAEPVLMTQVFIGTISQCINWWFKHKQTVTKEEMIDKLSDVFSKYMR